MEKVIENFEDFIRNKQSLNEASEGDYTVTKKQLDEIISKVTDKIKTTLDKEGKSTKTYNIVDSVSDTIKTYLEKKCKQ